MSLGQFSKAKYPASVKLKAAAELELRRRQEAAPTAHPASQTMLDFTLHTKPDYEVNWHHKVLCERLDSFVRGDTKRLMVFMPPRHGKSELVSRRLPAYILGQGYDATIIACSYSADLSSRMNRDVQRIIDSPEYREIFPDTQLNGTNIRSTSQGTYLRNSDIFEIVGHHGVYRSAGVGGGITGMGFRFGIIDDPIKSQKEADSATFRESVWEWYTSTFWTRQEKDARILLTLTRWHEDDLAGRLLDLAASDPAADQWDVLCLPAICEDEEAPYEQRHEGEALWPERYDLRFFAAAYANNPRQHAAINQQSPRAREGNLFKLSDLPIVPVSPAQGRRVRYWDLGGADSNTADYSVGVLINAAPDGRYYVEDVERGQWSPRERNERIRTTAAKDKAMHGYVATWVERVPGLAVEVVDAIVRYLAGYPIKTEMAKKDKVTRADPFADQCAAGNVSVVKADWNAAYRDELCSFPNGKKDDQVDGSSGAFSKVAAAFDAVVTRATPKVNTFGEY
jgi:predicted phage terminase large subunit-like protein